MKLLKIQSILKVNHMIFKLFDISLSKREVGASVFSFLWDDDSNYSLLGLYHQREVNVTVLYILFMAVAMDWDGNLSNDE